jgi:hypothetical protein
MWWCLLAVQHAHYGHYGHRDYLDCLYSLFIVFILLHYPSNSELAPSTRSASLFFICANSFQTALFIFANDLQ